MRGGEIGVTNLDGRNVATAPGKLRSNATMADGRHGGRRNEDKKKEGRKE